MKKLLNTLYVTTQGIYLHRENETLVAELDNKILLQLPIHTLSGIVCFGNVLCSPFLLSLCCENGIHVSFLTAQGNFMARVEGPVSGNVLLRIEQMKNSMEPAVQEQLASAFLIGKVLNCRTVLQRRLRDHGDNILCSSVITALANTVFHLKKKLSVDQLRGLEGDAANHYFSAFNELILAQKDDFSIQGRNRRPPLDRMNALLSFLYTLLAHDCEGALEGVGLDPQIGFLHALRPGRPSMALDLMEEFRPVLADRLALSLVNLRQIGKNGFKITETGAVVMNDDTRKTVLVAWQQKKKELVIHPFLNEKVEIGLLPHIQAL